MKSNDYCDWVSVRNRISQRLSLINNKLRFVWAGILEKAKLKIFRKCASTERVRPSFGLTILARSAKPTRSHFEFELLHFWPTGFGLWIFSESRTVLVELEPNKIIQTKFITNSNICKYSIMQSLIRQATRTRKIRPKPLDRILTTPNFGALQSF